MKVRKSISLIIVVLFIFLGIFSSRCSKEHPPVADFEADSTIIEQGGRVHFRDLSLNDPTEWTWRFEAGLPLKSTIQNPEVVYHNSGEYEVRLTVTNEMGADIIVRDNYIKVLTPFPVAEFTADTTVCEIDGVIRFEDLSIGKPAEWAWTFQGGNPQTSTARDPRVIYEEPGIYSVVLTVRNDRGTDTEHKESFVQVLYPRTDVKFNNNVFTDVKVTLGGETRIITPGNSTTYDDFEGFKTSYFAETSGTTGDDRIVGQVIYWLEPLVLNGESMDVNLDLSKEYFYLYLTNSGTHDLAPLNVNYGNSDQTVDYVLMKAEGKKYRVGYYKANPGLTIRAYWLDEPTSFTQWEMGVDFTLHFAKNQFVHVENTAK